MTPKSEQKTLPNPNKCCKKWTLGDSLGRRTLPGCQKVNILGSQNDPQNSKNDIQTSKMMVCRGGCQFVLQTVYDVHSLQNALQKGPWRLFSSSWPPRRLRGSKMLSRRPPGRCFRALGGPGCSAVPKCHPEGFLDAVFELLAAQDAHRLQNALQKASWRLFSSSWRPMRLRASKMFSRRPPGRCFRALGGPGGSEAPKRNPEGILDAVFELLAAQEAHRLRNALKGDRLGMLCSLSIYRT